MQGKALEHKIHVYGSTKQKSYKKKVTKTYRHMPQGNGEYRKGGNPKKFENNKEQGGANLLHSFQVRGRVAEGTDRKRSAERNQ